MNKYGDGYFPDPDDHEFCENAFDRVYALYGDDLDVSMMPEEHRTVILVQFATGYINNGGFEYLFEGNYCGDPCLELTAQAFRAIESPSASMAFDRAFRIFPRGKVPADIVMRARHYSVSNARRRAAINGMFWSAGREIKSCLSRYIRNHPDAFG